MSKAISISFKGGEFALFESEDATLAKWGTSDDNSAEEVKTSDGSTLDILYRSYVQPMIVLGIKPATDDNLSVNVEVDTEVHIVIALGNETGYSDPKYDELLKVSEETPVITRTFVL